MDHRVDVIAVGGPPAALVQRRLSGQLEIKYPSTSESLSDSANFSQIDRDALNDPALPQAVAEAIYNGRINRRRDTAGFGVIE
jgi:hypothetical protein